MLRVGTTKTAARVIPSPAATSSGWAPCSIWSSPRTRDDDGRKLDHKTLEQLRLRGLDQIITTTSTYL
jgi:hypothetical protein